MSKYMTKWGPLDSLRVKYYSYGTPNAGPTIGPFETREAAEESRSPHDGPVFENEATGLDAACILESLEKQKEDRINEEMEKYWRPM